MIFLFIICYLVPFSAYASSFAGNIKEGNRFYDQSEYGKALEKYEAAGETVPDSDIVHFNKGAAYYQKGQYQEAIDAFTKALNTEDKQTEADSTYNIANAKYKLGRTSADSDINSAISLYRESLDYYKRAIELDEENRDAKYNHELVEQELKILLDRQKNQEQQPDDQKKQEEGDNKEEQKGGGQDQETTESKEEKDGQDRQSGSDKMKEDEMNEQQAGDKETGKQQLSGGQKESDDAMSREEARMLLEAFGEEEARDAVKEQKRAYDPGVLKDW